MHQDQQVTVRGLTKAFDAGFEFTAIGLDVGRDGIDTGQIARTEHSRDFERGNGIRIQLRPKQRQTYEVEL